ncbi:hypothetical protein [Lentibacillus salicampi]|uniref:Uncharacterized protein n=1 Tax=Lentibacillus salicampi TaxID=175306 RepID=A0A4Y9AEX4_9BACI|nr:hypothetical protein [Lentibacillus salicampi]TFJ93647.1 hypothetical protein E4U82_06735 [Lentibacillus salicampi]
MTVYEALEKIPFKKREYFKWKHDIRYDQRLEKKSKEDFLRYVHMKTLNSFLKWEKTPEYRQLLMLLLEWRSTDDFEQIYDVVSNKAKEGDEKSIKLFLDLQKQIKQNAKAVKDLMGNDTEIEDDDDLAI